MYEKYEIVIGLEVHAQMATKTKLFSNAPVDSTALPNTCVDFFDIALPGTLPFLNFKCFELAVRTGLAINGTINKRSVFDRKHYFYPDLSSGYQITQMFEPIVQNGYLEIEVQNMPPKKVRINRIHIEQDAGKLTHDLDSKNSYVDYNRAGVPLMEIVTEPDISGADEACEYLKQLQAILREIETSDADMEKGNFRCDVNISVRLKGSTTFGNRVEVKNLNSTDAVRRAIEHEFRRQVELTEAGKEVFQETRLFDTELNSTKVLRSKEDAIDYKYFNDPDLVPVVLDDQFISDIAKTLPELPLQRKKRFMKIYELSAYDAGVLSAEKFVAGYFDEVVRICGDAKLAANLLSVELFGRLNKYEILLKDCKVTPKHLAELVILIKDGTISGKIAKEVLDISFESGRFPLEIVKTEGLQQVVDTGAIELAIKKVVENSPKQLESYKTGNTKLFGFFVGQVLKEMSGKGNPQIINDLLKKYLG